MSSTLSFAFVESTCNGVIHINVEGDASHACGASMLASIDDHRAPNALLPHEGKERLEDNSHHREPHPRPVPR